MTLQDVFDLAKFFLSLKDNDGREEMLVKCCNLAYRSTAQGYLPLYFTETAALTDGELLLRDLSKDIVAIKSVTDKNGAEILYKLFVDRIKAGAPEIVITYAYLPEEVELPDELDYVGGKVDARLLAYGAAAEFCLIAGLYDDAAVWDARYALAVRAAQRPKSSLRLPARPWRA